MAVGLAFANWLSESFADQAITTSEMALVARAKTGDHQAFEALVRRYKDRVLNLAPALSA